ncbi:MAG: hypothetical protein V4819_25830 [Verrucomicrobiota bacterium]
MKTTFKTPPQRWQSLLGLIFLAAVSLTSAIADPEILYVGDNGTNTVKRFNALTGQAIGGGHSAGIYVAPNSGGLFGPRALLVDSGKLLVVNQNQGQPLNGEILRYRLSDGLPDQPLVAASDAQSPYAPLGAVSWRGVIYVSDFTDSADGTGKLLAFDEKKGTFLDVFDPPADFAHSFHPRGLVIGSNGLLYVANVPTFPPSTGGEVLVFDPETLDFIGAFISDIGGIGQLNRPEGLVFGPDGNLYITSFRADPTDVDSIRIYDPTSGSFIDKIELYASGQPRAFAQALLFGPGGKLFVPITGGNISTAGQVRRYNVTTKLFNLLVPAGASLVQPFYLTFDRTDPGTLRYRNSGRDHHQ